jgi:hypothetical protein
MLCLAEVQIEEKIDKDTTLFSTARHISQQLTSHIKEQRLPLFANFKKGVETGEQAAVFNSYPEGSYSEFLPSNKVIFKYPTKYSWGEMTSVHTLGSYWSPFFSNRIVLYHSVNGVMNYSIVCCQGEDNVRDTREVMELFTAVMENSERISENTKVMDLVAF